MITLYLLCLLLGTVALVVLLARRPEGVEELLPTTRSLDPDELTVPGARIEPSDEFAVEGGAGGAEGEGGSPGYEDGADGGIGGAEGGDDSASVRRPFPTVAAYLAAFVAGFGGVGYVLERSLGEPAGAGSAAAGGGGALPLLLGVAGGCVLGFVGVLALRFVGNRRAEGGGD